MKIQEIYCSENTENPFQHFVNAHIESTVFVQRNKAQVSVVYVSSICLFHSAAKHITSRIRLFN